MAASFIFITFNYNYSIVSICSAALKITSVSIKYLVQHALGCVHFVQL